MTKRARSTSPKPERSAGAPLADIVKRRHVAIRQRMRALDGDSAAAWHEAVTDDAGLAEYADAMHRLATEHWATGSGRRYDDRVAYGVEVVSEYFGGANPRVLAAELKVLRTDFFAHHARSMTSDECSAATRSAVARLFGAIPPQAELHVLDVGSCYNPFREPFSSQTLRTECGASPCALRPVVSAVDIGPLPASGVARCDWANAPFGPAPEIPAALFSHGPSPLHLRPTEGAMPTVQHAVPSSAHAVIFSLLLSYLPTPQMRVACCANAHRVLRPHGLLVVISTRTQGRRSGRWIEDWVAVIEALGFRRVRQDIRHKLVGMAFRKVTDAPAELPAELQERLTITADDTEGFL